MKKIKVKAKEIKKTVSQNGISFDLIHDEKAFTGNYALIYANKVLEDGRYLVISGVIDRNYKPVVPLRKSIITEEEFLNNDSKINVILYENSKVIYEYNDEFYLMKLNVNKFDDLKPTGFIMKLYSLYDFGNNNIIASFKNKSFLYNVKDGMINSEIFDYIEPIGESGKLFNAYMYIENKNVNPLEIKAIIDDSNNMEQRVIINDSVEVIAPHNIKRKKELIKYCDDCFNTYYDSIDGDYECQKILQ